MIKRPGHAQRHGAVGRHRDASQCARRISPATRRLLKEVLVLLFRCFSMFKVSGPFLGCRVGVGPVQGFEYGSIRFRITGTLSQTRAPKAVGPLTAKSLTSQNYRPEARNYPPTSTQLHLLSPRPVKDANFHLLETNPVPGLCLRDHSLGSSCRLVKACVYIYKRIRQRVYMYVCICICIYIYIYLFIYLYTHREKIQGPIFIT